MTDVLLLDPRLHVLGAPRQLSADGLIGADGTIWSHACTVGQYTRGEAFNLDRSAIENFVRVFRAGYPSKVPVDYEHSSTSMDPEVRKLRAQGEVTKAGDVQELKGVFSLADFSADPSLLAAATKLAELAQRPLDDPRNLGLWMRWKPTARALGKIKDGEFSELSITFDDNWPDKVTGQGQGPTILAVALTMLPFLDGMLPVAASRGGRANPDRGGAPGTTREEQQMTTRTLSIIAAVAALTGKTPADDDGAVAELTALAPDITRLRELGVVVSEAFAGERDPAKIKVKLTELATSVATYKGQAEAAEAKRIDGEVEAAMKEHEDRIVPATKTIFANALRTELKAGTALKECATYKALAAIPKHGLTVQSAVGDDSGERTSTNTSADDALDRAATELMATDPEIKELRASKDAGERQRGFDLAYDRAAQKIKYRSPQQLRAVP